MPSDNEELKRKCCKAIETTMIGSLYAIEYEMEEDLKDPEFREIYAKIRTRILGLGNKQINEVDRTFRNYSVTSNVNHYQLPFKGNS